MKIAVVSGHASPLAARAGGAADGQSVYVDALSTAMTQRGHEVTVFTRRDDPDVPDRVKLRRSYAVVHLPAGPFEPRPAAEVFEHMSEFSQHLDTQWAADRPDVAHAHFWMSGVATQLAAGAQHIPTVQTFHSLGAVERRYQEEPDAVPGPRQKLEALVARHASWVTASCSDEVTELIRLGRARTKISVVPPGVDTVTFTSQGRVAPRTATHRIVAAGYILPRNGFDTVVEALALLADTELVIVGGAVARHLDDDAEVQRLRAIAAEYGVAERVRFMGSVARAEMPAILRSADVVACTAWYEPFGNVALEAMACGIPVVASAVGGMMDTVVDDVTGLLVTPNKPRECAEAISTILHDPFLRRGMGMSGRDRACVRYNWDRVADDILRIYERLVPNPDATPAGESKVLLHS